MIVWRLGWRFWGGKLEGDFVKLTEDEQPGESR